MFLFDAAIMVFTFLPAALILLWLLVIRPYCRRNGKGYTAGTNIGATAWVDWQEATEVARSKQNNRMLAVCRLFLALQIAFVLLSVAGITFAMMD